MPNINSADMARLARAANAVVRHIRSAVDRFAPDALSDRQNLARALLTSAIDHSVALTELLAANDPYCAYSAITLFRPQLDALARGTFFALDTLSSDDEVASFLANDEMPKRDMPDGKRRRPTLAELLAETRAVLLPFLPPHLRNQVDQAFTYDIGVYAGFVHGGMGVTKAYRLVQRRFIYVPDFHQAALHARHSIGQAHLAEGILRSIVYQLGPPELSFEGRAELIDAYGAVIKELDAKFWEPTDPL